MQKTRIYYKKLVKTDRDYKNLLINFLQAFFFGGALCLFGQFILSLYNLYLDDPTSATLLSMTIIMLATILTVIGIYDELGQICKCGLAVPISGFANACVCSSLEYHSEGIISIGSNCFRLAGSVIVVGTSVAIIFSSLRYLIWVIS